MKPVLNLSSFLKTYFGDEKVLSISKTLNEKKGVLVKGLAGSSSSFIIRAVIENRSGIHLIILQDKEQAAYFLNDLETLGCKALFFPSSCKHPFSAEEADTPSIQLRAEALNELRLNPSLAVVSYPEAMQKK